MTDLVTRLNNWIGCLTGPLNRASPDHEDIALMRDCRDEIVRLNGVILSLMEQHANEKRALLMVTDTGSEGRRRSYSDPQGSRGRWL